MRPGPDAKKILVCRVAVLPYTETFIKEQISTYSTWKPVLIGTHRVPGLPLDDIETRVLFPAGRNLTGKVCRRISRSLNVALFGLARLM